jgi:transcription elongation factor GreA
MADSFPMTVAGHQALKDELKNLKSVERPNIVAAIEEARAHGDLSENAEYHAAKERQGEIEGRIAMIEGKLSRANIIDVSSLSGDRVVFGATVTIIYLDDDSEKTYMIVGEDEADTKQAKISINSPIARALIGKEVGDEVAIRTPGGVKECEVGGVEFK